MSDNGATEKTAPRPDSGSVSVLTARWSADWPLLGGLALVAVLGVFWAVGGLWGVVGWLLVALLWVLFPSVIAFVGGQFVLVALLPPESGFIPLGLGVGALGGLVLADLTKSASSLFDGLIFVGLSIVFVTGVVLLTDAAGMLTAVIATVVLISVSSYFCHRYLILELRDVTDEYTSTEDATLGSKTE